ncbi:GNAT family N-acetyltransferase [Paenibacillus spongiae]|uniref:GNAT family N-acetyltransferase n=1 Tax=Paenibacillus spongiae TaxID=2909671 RepID=A0ABY5SHU5_9BACL|nr:GNAT family N-acetyltransferase [Paenibacillus spongiae]UVI33319.1 GNAT family N-acetyltransferase [Paenibacillus spongiae]
MAAICRRSVIQTVKTVLSADLACSESNLITDAVSVHEAVIREGRFRFPVRRQTLSIVTMGKGAVISCNPERMEWVRQHLEPLTRGQIFSAGTIAATEDYVQRDNQYIAGPDQKYVCSTDDLKAFKIPHGINISICDRSSVTNLYEHTNFSHALSFRTDCERPDMLASIAECEGKIVGIAGASADCDFMWQIGVDVLPEYQGRGIGKAIVGTLTKAILDEGITPYYSTEVSNLQSRQLAISLGYWPAWIQLYARDRT